MPVSGVVSVEGARKNAYRGVRQFAEGWLAGAQFDDLECRDLLRASRSGCRYRCAGLNLDLQAMANQGSASRLRAHDLFRSLYPVRTTAEAGFLEIEFKDEGGVRMRRRRAVGRPAQHDHE